MDECAELRDSPFQRKLSRAGRVFKNAEDPDSAIEVADVKHPERMQHANREFGRLFHDYLASAMTLRDHSRALFKEAYEGTKVEEVYEKRLDDEIKKDELYRFVQDLRNFMLHKGVPDAERSMHWHAELGMTAGLALIKADLLEFKNWTSAAKRFLQK